MKRTILLVDDSLMIRNIVSMELSSDYEVLLAESGQRGIEILKEQLDNISLILLDLVMPKMDGIETLHLFTKIIGEKDIPIFIITGEKRTMYEKQTLAMGAYDFIEKPLDINVLKLKIEKTLKRSSISRELAPQSESLDKLTNIYNKDKFFSSVQSMLSVYRDKSFAFIRIDIDRFKLINTYFGQKAGDAILRSVATKIQNIFIGNHNAVFGRVGGDVFAMCFEYDKNNRDTIVEECKASKYLFSDIPLDINVVPSVGIYFIEDNFLPVTLIYDRAKIAAEKCKSSYTQICTVFEPYMEKELLMIQEITNEMETSLDTGKFKIFYQKKYDLKTEKPIGAEALVRWRHPIKGMVPPDDFIPLFENNGFITTLDSYVFEEVCINVRKWLNDGKTVLPISVNLSRIDLFNDEFLYSLKERMEYYQIPYKLINLEITESAFTESSEKLIGAVNLLHDFGFLIEMDDFGKGYSSLNMINDLPFDIIKIDVRFLQSKKNSRKSQDILQFIIELSEKMNIPTICEGIETSEDLELLRSINCPYGQGYYFSKPIDKEEFEKELN